MDFFVLNTNRRLNKSGKDEKVMLSERIAAAYKARKQEIKKLSSGDVVFLYATGEGIIAFGVVNSELRMRTYDGLEEGEYYKTLKAFHILRTPISAAEIKTLTKVKRNFYKTLTRLKPGIGKSIMSRFDEELFVAAAA